MDQESRLFFHDLVNQTHGIGLFLNYKINVKQNLSLSECEALASEIKIMQSLIKDHFHLNHKNLTNSYDLVPFESVRTGLAYLIESFLPVHRVSVDCRFKGQLDLKLDIEERRKCYVHQASFFRIMTNIVKNIAESGSEKMELEFTYNQQGLTVLVKNMIFNLKSDQQNLSAKLKELILNENKSYKSNILFEGLGLESISNICQKLGGHFNFGLHDGSWVTEIFLPNPRPDLWDKENSGSKNAA